MTHARQYRWSTALDPRAAFHGSRDRQRRNETLYGYLWWLNRFGEDESSKAFFMSGNGGNKVVAFPALNQAVVVTSRNFNARGMRELTARLIANYLLPASE